MDLPKADEETNGDYTFLYFIYGFLALFAFCIVFSLGKAIYHYYKKRIAPNVAVTEESIDTECHSISNENSVSDRQIENNALDSNRLPDQLDKLRRLLNRLNAMGTFSRDTIGDLSSQSEAYVNNSVAASSDLSAFWSSIDFDDFEETMINEDNFRKTPTEKSVSLSVSDFSLDTSGIQFDNFRQKTIPTSSKEYILNPSKFNNQTNPSEAIVQILSILDSIIQKNINNAGTSQNNTLKFEKNCDKSTNIKSLSRSAQSVESFVSQKKPMLSSTVSMNKKSTPRSELFDCRTSISASGYMNSRILNTESKIVCNSLLKSEPNCLDQVSQFIDSQCKLSSTVSITANLSKELNVTNITSSSESSSFYTTKLSTSSKSLDTDSVSRSVNVFIDPITLLSTQVKEDSNSLLAVPKESNLLVNENTKQLLTETRVAEGSLCAIDTESMKKSHSLSDLLDDRLAALSILLGNDKSYDQKKPEALNFNFDKKPLPVIRISESPNNSQIHSPQNSDIPNNECDKHKCRTLQSNKNKFSSISSNSLQSPIFSDTATIKSSVSESGMKQSPFWGMLSPNLSSTRSEEFLTPVLEADISPFKKVDWKSPVEAISENYMSRNLTPYNVNALLSKKCIWATPPSPGEITSYEVKKHNIYKTSSMQI